MAKLMTDLQGNAKEDYLAYMKRLAEQQKQAGVSAAQTQLENSLAAAAKTDEAAAKAETEAYRLAAEKQERERNDAQRVSGLQAERIAKFLPQSMASQGLTGGLAQSLTVDAFNAAARRSSDAGRTYAESMRALDAQRMQSEADRAVNRVGAEEKARDTYAAAVAAAQREKAEREREAYDVDYQRRYAEEQYNRQMAEQQRMADSDTYVNAFDEMMAAQLASLAGNGEYVTEDDFDAWAEKTRQSAGYARLTENQRALIDSNIEKYRATVVRSSQMGAVTGSYVSGDHNKKLDEGDDITVSVGGEEYAIQSAGETKEEGAIKAAKTLKEKTVFLYEGEAYIKYRTKVYRLEPHGKKTEGKHKENYDMLIEALQGVGRQ